jgi:hypothetical protein
MVNPSKHQFYKIRHKKSGLYSKGGMDVVYGHTGTGSCWNKSGKTWDTLGKIRSHITLVRDAMSRIKNHASFDDWEIVTFEVNELPPQDVISIVDPKKLLEWLKE